MGKLRELRKSPLISRNGAPARFLPHRKAGGGMDSRQFLTVPIRLRHDAPDFLERLASLGPLCFRARNLAAELAAMTDPGCAVLADAGNRWFPASGVSLAASRIAGVHALRADRLQSFPGVVEIDFSDERFPLGIAVPPEGTAGLSALVADFCTQELEAAELIAWRRGLCAPFEPCSCCKSSIELRRAHAHAHPLAAIFADAIQCGLEFHVRVGAKGYAFDRFLRPAKIDLAGAITVNDAESSVILRMDPALTHSVRIETCVQDREPRTKLMVHDLLGNESVVLSSEGTDHAERWRRLCYLAGS